MKTPLIDLCFYAKTDLEEWLQLNPFMRHIPQILDSDGYHVLFLCKGETPSEGPLYIEENKIGYIAKASPEMVARVQRLKEQPGRN
jgi:hypothetical protein